MCAEILIDICRFSHSNSQLCFIESMSEKERLTLKEIYSDELSQSYSAIYRNSDEFLNIMHEAFDKSFRLVCDDIMHFDDGRQKEREHVTLEHFVVWKGRKYVNSVV